MAHYLGGLEITDMSWEGDFALSVRFTSTYGDTYCYQLYSGREFVGYTERTTDREVTGQVITSPNGWPEHITLLAVDPAERLTDYGALLPPRPYNRVKFIVNTTGWPADTRFVEITGGTEPGGAVDTNNVLQNLLFDTNGQFSTITDPLEGTGEWNFEIAGRDATRPDGNRGDPISVSADIVAHPPDVEFAEDGYNRFTVDVTGGTLTVTFTEAA